METDRNCKSYDCEKLDGVGCDVAACRFNESDNRCSAQHINIESRSAMKKGETFCSTFSPKSST